MAILVRGSKGSAVSALQTSLNAIGYNLKVDGDYGKATYDAVRNVQSGAGLVVDGKAGPKTLYAIQNQGTAHVDHLTEADLVRAAQSLKAELAAVKAVNAVESKGAGFTKTGKLKVLFERHKMYKYLKLKFGAAKANQLAAQYPSLVNTSAGGYLGGDAENGRLAQAIAIDADCAYMSASYGLYQIMGFNHAICGYPDAKSMYDAFLTGEGKHLEAFIAFVKANQNLWTAIINKNWAAFAKGYNGVDYQKNKYDTKLQAAYDSFL